MRESEPTTDKSMLLKADMDMSIDFLDAIDEDIPRSGKLILFII